MDSGNAMELKKDLDAVSVRPACGAGRLFSGDAERLRLEPSAFATLVTVKTKAVKNATVRSHGLALGSCHSIIVFDVLKKNFFHKPPRCQPLHPQEQKMPIKIN